MKNINKNNTTNKLYNKSAKNNKNKKNKNNKNNRNNRNNKNKKITNWSEYNKSLENRGNFSVLLDVAYLNNKVSQTGKAGHPFEYSDSIILFLAQLREFMQLPLRQTVGMAKFIFKQASLEMKLPSYITLSRRLAKLDIPTHLDKIKFNSPIIFLPDSTGLKISGEGEWKVKKHGADKHRKWVKVHLGIDYSTGAVLATSTTESTTNDGHELLTLLDQVDEARRLIDTIPKIANVTADGAYDQHELYKETKRRSIDLLTPPPKNAKWHGDIKGARLVDKPDWEKRNSYVRDISRLGRDEWKKQSGYHKRSLAETGMSRLKLTFGSRLKSKKITNQMAEVKLRVSLLNLFTSYGRPAYAA